MTWKADLVTRLRAHAGLAALCGARIAWFEAARGWGHTYPQLVLQEIDPGRAYTHDGPDALEQPRVQFDIYAEGGAAIDAVGAALAAAMEAGGSAGATTFHEGFLQSRATGDPEDLGDQRRVQRMTIDFSFFHEPT